VGVEAGAEVCSARPGFGGVGEEIAGFGKLLPAGRTTHAENFYGETGEKKEEKAWARAKGHPPAEPDCYPSPERLRVPSNAASRSADARLCSCFTSASCRSTGSSVSLSSAGGEKKR